MEIRDSITGILQVNKFGMTPKEIAKALKMDTAMVHENLLVMTGLQQVSQRQVGRDRVFMLTKPEQAEQIAVPAPASAEVTAAATPAPAEPPAKKPAKKPAAAKPAPEEEKQPEAVKPQPVPEVAPARKIEPVPEPVPAAVAGPTLYDRVGGQLTLNIGDEPLTVGFGSVEQLHRFLGDLIEQERNATP